MDENVNQTESTPEIVENTPAAEEQHLEQSGEEGTPEVVETDEEKNARVMAEEAERARVREEKRQGKINRRINEITAEKYEATRRADELAEQNRKLLETLQRGLGGNNHQVTNTDGAPQREQFEHYEDFVEARAEWKANKVVEERIAKYQEEQSKKAEVSNFQKEERETAQRFVAARDALKETLPDYDEVVEDWEPAIPANVQQMIVRLPEGPLLSYHMAKNPALEAQFKNQPEYMHGVILGQIVSQLKSPAKVTKAPPPGKPVSSSSSAVNTGDYNGPPDGYLAWARKNMK